MNTNKNKKMKTKLNETIKESPGRKMPLLYKIIGSLFVVLFLITIDFYISFADFNRWGIHAWINPLNLLFAIGLFLPLIFGVFLLLIGTNKLKRNTGSDVFLFLSFLSLFIELLLFLNIIRGEHSSENFMEGTTWGKILSSFLLFICFFGTLVSTLISTIKSRKELKSQDKQNKRKT